MNEAKRQFQIDPVMVREYLIDNPDFFNRHPELLLSLEVPHPDRGTVSLVERQQNMLRHRIAQLESEITTLLATATRNEDVYRYYGDLAFKLFEYNSLEEIGHMLSRKLKSKFGFSEVRLLIAEQPGQFETPEITATLRHRLDRKGYCLGRLPSRETRLFVDQETGSIALLGLGKPGEWIGMLAIADKDPSHFDADMDTFLLEQLKIALELRITQMKADG